MLRAHRAPLRLELAWRLLAPLLALAVVLSAGVVTPDPVLAGSSSTVASLRQRQLSAEAAMRRADKQIERLLRQRRHGSQLLRTAKQKLEKAIARRKALEGRAEKDRLRLGDLKLTLARETRVRPNPSGTQKVDKPVLRKRITKLQKEVQRLDKKVRKTQKKEARARALKQSRLDKPGRARIEARKRERERSEAKLSSAVNAMIALSRQRAGGLGKATTKRFTRPLRGNVSQAFGCTGRSTNPRRGTCRHFHDGVDLAAPKGTKVRAAADGYVAYVGFSPWDDGSRAYVVIIGHADGFESVYAHLQPKRAVRAGQKVKRGDVIGRVGMTGLTSGPHVHWELRQGGVYLNPLRAGR